jgi:hypothetical protein
MATDRIPGTPLSPATALPWKCWQSLDDNSENVANRENAFVCEVGKIASDTDSDAIRADARYIVHAANAYPKLIEALREAAPNHPMLVLLGEATFNKEPEAVHV